MQPVGNCQSSSPREAAKPQICLDLMGPAMLGVELDTLKGWPLTTRKLRFPPSSYPFDSRGAAICLARLAEVSLGMRNSLRNLVQTVWSDRRPTAMDCAMLLLMALLTCLTLITAIGQWTACAGIR